MNHLVDIMNSPDDDRKMAAAIEQPVGSKARPTRALVINRIMRSFDVSRAEAADLLSEYIRRTYPARAEHDDVLDGLFERASRRGIVLFRYEVIRYVRLTIRTDACEAAWLVDNYICRKTPRLGSPCTAVGCWVLLVPVIIGSACGLIGSRFPHLQFYMIAVVLFMIPVAGIAYAVQNGKRRL
jgi:hypothetical protein